MELSSKTLMSLRPSEDTSAAIAASIEAITAFKQAVEARIPEMTVEKGDILLNGSDKDLKSHESRIAALHGLLDDADAMLAKLNPKLAEVRRAEQVAELRAEQAELSLPARMADWARRFKQHYPIAAAAIADLLVEERELDTSVRKASIINQRLEALGEAPFEFQGSTIRAVNGGVPVSVRTYGELVMLPGILGAPKLQLVTREETTTRVVDNSVWNDQTQKYELDGTREITEKRQVIDAGAEDYPFWWNNRQIHASVAPIKASHQLPDTVQSSPTSHAEGMWQGALAKAENPFGNR